MRTFLIWFFLSLIVTASFSQSRINVSEGSIFQSSKDSIKFAAFQAMMQRILSKPGSEKEMDSIDRAIKTYIRPTPAGYRKVYSPLPNYFPFDSLLLIKIFRGSPRLPFPTGATAFIRMAYLENVDI